MWLRMLRQKSSEPPRSAGGESSLPLLDWPLRTGLSQVSISQTPPPPRYGKQMCEHDSAPVGKESGHTTNAKEEEIFSDMS